MVGRPKRGQSRLSPQPDPNVARLREEVAEEFRRLSLPDDCCVSVRLDGDRVGVRQWLNLHAGENVTITASDDPRSDEVDVTIDASAAEGAPSDASYVVMGFDGELSAERVLTAGAGIAIADGGPGNPVTISSTVVAGAPTDSQYVVMASSASLSAERVLTAGTGISITDGGANGPVTIASTSTRLLYEVDFSSFADTNLLTGGDGNKTIDGRTWVLTNSANATAFSYGATPVGLRCQPNTTATDFSQTVQTSPYLSITWPALLGASFDASRSYLMQVHVSEWTNPVTVSSNEIILGVRGAANGTAAFASWVGIGMLGTTAARLKGNGGTADRTTAPAPTAAGTTDRVLGIKVTDYAGIGYIDQYGAGWPAPGNVVARSLEGGTTNSTEALLDAVGGITLSWRSAGTAGTFASTIRRLRVLLAW